MTYVLRFKDSDGNTLNLTGGSILLAEPWAPRTPSASVVERVMQTLRDGGDVTAVTRRNVTEGASLLLTGSDASDIFDLKGQIETYLARAEHFQEKRQGVRVWVEYSPDDTYQDVLRSQVFHGQVALDAKSASRAHWAEAAVRAALSFKRAFYWEATSLTELSLSNGHGTGTGGISVYNCDDGTYDNWVQIAGGSIAGGIPTPAKISFYNPSAGSRVYHVWAGMNVYSSPGTFTCHLEGESASGISGSGADSSCSGGNYGYRSSIGPSATRYGYWTISGAQLNAAASGRFRLFMRPRNATDISEDLYVQAQLRYPGGSGGSTVVAQTTEVYTGASGAMLYDLGVLQLPPWLAGQTSFYALDLALYARQGDGTNTDLHVDYLHLMPLDGYRHYRPAGYGIAQYAQLVDDGPEDEIYVDIGGAKAGHYVKRGQPSYLWPGKTTRLRFLHQDITGGVDVDRANTVQVYYRPRYL